MKKPASRHQPSKKVKVWVIALGLSCLGLLVWFVINVVLIAQDSARFAEVSKEKTRIASQLASSLGSNVISTREQDECFNAEQGPWDNGHLWCQTATIMTLHQGLDYAGIGSRYLNIGKDLGFKGDYIGGLFPKYWLQTNQNIECQLEYKGSQNMRQGGARRIPFKDSELIALAITCADHARASYYRYNN